MVMCQTNVSFHTASAHPAVMSAWWNENCRIVNGISCRKCAEFSPEELRPYGREFEYQWCKLRSLLNSWGYQTINLHIFIYIYRYMKIDRIPDVNFQTSKANRNRCGLKSIGNTCMNYGQTYEHLHSPTTEHQLTLKVLNFWKFTSYCSLNPYGRAWGK